MLAGTVAAANGELFCALGRRRAILERIGVGCDRSALAVHRRALCDGARDAGVIRVTCHVAALVAADVVTAEAGLARAVGIDWKGKLSPVIYMLAIGSTFMWNWVAQALYVAVAVLWLVPDRRIEKVVRPNAV